MSEQTVRKSKWGKVGKVMLIFATVLLCLLGAAYSLTDIGSAASSYEKNRDEAKAAGLCFTVDDAKKLFAVPDKENGAILLGDLLKAIKEHHLNSSYQVDELSDHDFLVAWGQIEPHLSELQVAVSKPHLIFPPIFSDLVLNERNVLGLRGFVHSIVRRADIAVKKGEVKLADDLLPLAANLSVHLADESSLTAMRFRSSAAMKIEAKLRSLIVNHGRDPSWQKTIEKTLGILNRSYDVKRVLQFEHWDWLQFGRIMLADSSAGTLEDLGLKREDSTPNIYLASKLVPRFQAANLSRLHQYYAEAVKGLPVDPNDVAGIAKSMAKAYSAIDYSDRSVSYSYMRFRAVGSIELVESVEIESARRNVLLQSLAILKSGSNLSKGLPLAGNFAQDVDGRTLGLDHTKDGWVIYSVGENGTDEYGALGCDDFVVRLPK